MPHRVGTPLIRLSRWCDYGPLWVKAEHTLPTGSAFDRIAGDLIDALIGDARDTLCVMAGGGSQCLAFAAAAAIRDVPLVVVCPDTTLGEHQILLGYYPCRVIASPGSEGLHGAHEAAVALCEAEGGRLLFGPKARESAVKLMAASLGQELAAQLSGRPVDAVIAPVNSGAILEGIGRALPGTRLVGTVSEPPSLQDGTVDRASAPAIGAELVDVDDRFAYDTRLAVARREGLLVGLASAGAIGVARRMIAGGQISSAAAIAVDAGDRYFSADAALAPEVTA